MSFTFFEIEKIDDTYHYTIENGGYSQARAEVTVRRTRVDDYSGEKEYKLRTDVIINVFWRVNVLGDFVHIGEYKYFGKGKKTAMREVCKFLDSSGWREAVWALKTLLTQIGAPSREVLAVEFGDDCDNPKLVAQGLLRVFQKYNLEEK